MSSNPRVGQILAMDANSVKVKDSEYTLVIDEKSYWIVLDISSFGSKVWLEIQMVHPDALAKKHYSQTELYYLLPDSFVLSSMKFQLV